MGGAYGGKITRSIHASVACAVAASITGKPVRVQVHRFIDIDELDSVVFLLFISNGFHVNSLSFCFLFCL